MFLKSDILELLVIIAISVVIIYQLYKKLGTRVGFEKPLSNDVPDPLSQNKDRVSDIPNQLQKNLQSTPENFHAVLKDMATIQANFDLEDFKRSATRAFEMIITAYCQNNVQLLKQLLAPKLFSEFEQAIAERQTKGHRLSTLLVKLMPPEIENITLNQTQGRITLRLCSEQTNILYDHKNQVLEGSDKQIEEVIDVWTFTQDMSLGRPEWLLMHTAGS